MSLRVACNVLVDPVTCTWHGVTYLVFPCLSLRNRHVFINHVTWFRDGLKNYETSGSWRATPTIMEVDLMPCQGYLCRAHRPSTCPELGLATDCLAHCGRDGPENPRPFPLPRFTAHWYFRSRDRMAIAKICNLWGTWHCECVVVSMLNPRA